MVEIPVKFYSATRPLHDPAPPPKPTQTVIPAAQSRNPSRGDAWRGVQIPSPSMRPSYNRHSGSRAGIHPRGSGIPLALSLVEEPVPSPSPVGATGWSPSPVAGPGPPPVGATGRSPSPVAGPDPPPVGATGRSPSPVWGRSPSDHPKEPAGNSPRLSNPSHPSTTTPHPRSPPTSVVPAKGDL